MASGKKPWLWLLVGAAVLVFGCLSTCIGSVFFCGKSTFDVADAAKAELRTFFDSIKQGHSDAAYAETSKEFQKHVSREEFTTQVTRLDLPHVAKVDLAVRGVHVGYGSSPTAAQIAFKLHPAAGGPALEGIAELRVEGERWRVHQLDMSGEERTPAVLMRDAGNDLAPDPVPPPTPSR